nr:hypothetical protein C17E4.7 - Caenorhabditis elegans [Caenorhabditis elegans]
MLPQHDFIFFFFAFSILSPSPPPLSSFSSPPPPSFSFFIASTSFFSSQPPSHPRVKKCIDTHTTPSTLTFFSAHHPLASPKIHYEVVLYYSFFFKFRLRLLLVSVAHQLLE